MTTIATVDTSAPTEAVTERWRVGTDASTADSGPILVDGTVYTTFHTRNGNGGLVALAA